MALSRRERLQKMIIDDIDGELFSYLAHWIYHQVVEDDKSKTRDHLTLVKLWQLAERFLIPTLQNHIIGILYEWFAAPRRIYGPTLRVLNYVYAEQPSTTEPLRRLFVASFSHHAIQWQNSTSAFPRAFMGDVASYLKVIHDKIPAFYRPSMQDVSDFHVKE